MISRSFIGKSSLEQEFRIPGSRLRAADLVPDGSSTSNQQPATSN
jgi:hypothetical protein